MNLNSVLSDLPIYPMNSLLMKTFTRKVRITFIYTNSWRLWGTSSKTRFILYIDQPQLFTWGSHSSARP